VSRGRSSESQPWGKGVFVRNICREPGTLGKGDKLRSGDNPAGPAKGNSTHCRGKAWQSPVSWGARPSEGIVP
jgi:hypothetical protein